jgi:hypothetical protein
MTGHDDAFLDSVAVLALGALPEAEATAVAAHVATCRACRREYDELRTAADLVGYAAEAAPGELDAVSSARLKARVMRAVRGDAAPAYVSAASPDGAAARALSPRRAPWLVYGALAAAVALALLEGASLAGLRAQTSAQAAAARQALADRATLARRLAEIVAPGSKHFAVPSGEVIESGGRILLAFSHLPDAPGGKVYQAWTLARGAKTVAPSITFSADPSGTTVIELPQSAAHLAAIAVSVEPPGGSRAPTSKPTFVRALS